MSAAVRVDGVRVGTDWLLECAACGPLAVIATGLTPAQQYAAAHMRLIHGVRRVIERNP
jgi:hypothetical protein